MATIVGVFAHPDDEAFGPGGTLTKLVQEGNEVHVICCTDGNHQEKGLKNIRNKELRASADILGIKQVLFLDFVDGSLSNSLYHQLANALKTKLDELHPDTIITFHPNGVSGHLDHIAVTSVVNWLFPKLDYVKKIMYFCMREIERAKIDDYFVYMPSGVSQHEADLIVNVEDVWSTVVSAMRAHASQKEDCDWILESLANLSKEDYFLVQSKSA